MNSSDSPVPRTRPTRANTSFFGRTRELTELKTNLAQGARWLTVLGPAGIGKSRLVQQILDEVDIPGFRVVCPLANASSVKDLYSCAALAVGMTTARDDSHEELCRVFSRSGGGVLVLDDADRLIGELITPVERWLTDNPDLVILMTAREPAHSRWERRLELAPLEAAEARALLVERACSLGAQRDNFQQATLELDAIVQSLDYNPLAIELAAPWLTTLSPTQLRERLDDRFQLLVDRRGVHAGRHHALEETLEWSWERLSQAQQQALLALTVLRGSFELDDAVALCRALGHARGQELSLVQSLREKSLLRVVDGCRCQLVIGESVRRFLHTKAPEGPAPGVVKWHALYFVQAVDEAADADAAYRRVARTRENLEVIALEQENPALRARAALHLAPVLRAHGPPALRRALYVEHSADGLPSGLAIPLAVAAAEVHRQCGELCCAAQRLAGVEAWLEEVDGRLRARWLLCMAQVRMDLANAHAARDLLTAALHEAESAGDAASVVVAKARLASLLGDAELGDEALSLAEAVPDQQALLIALGNAARLKRQLGRFADAARHAERGITVARGLGDKNTEGLLQTVLAATLQLAQQPERAVHAFGAAIAVNRQAGNRRFEVLSQAALGALLHFQGRPEDAQVELQDALRAARGIDDPWVLGTIRIHLAALAATENDLNEAERHLTRLPEAGDPSLALTIEALTGIVELARARVAKDPDSNQARQWRRAALERLERLERGATDSPAPRRSAAAEARPAIALLREALSGAAPIETELPRRQCVVGGECAWFRMDDQREPMDLTRRKPLRRIFVLLLEAQRHGTRLRDHDILRVGWPGERLSTSAGKNRIYNAISTLRSMGLGPYLVRRNRTYFLQPALIITDDSADSRQDVHEGLGSL